MASSLDLSLPETVPEIEQFRESSDFPFALYTLYDDDEQDIAELQRIYEADCEMEGIVMQAPHHRFTNRSLKDIVRYHVALAEKEEFDPRYFVVLVTPEWRTKGVVLVTLDDDDLQCRPDLLWIQAAEVGLTLVNLQISNTDWAETKEGVGEELAAEDNDDDDDNEDPSGGCEKDDEANDTENEDFGEAPPMGFHIGVYVHSTLDHRQVLNEIEPASDIKKASEFVCKVLHVDLASINHEEGLISRAAVSYSRRLANHPTLHKSMFLVADDTGFPEAGLSLVELRFDPQSQNKNLEETGKTGASSIQDSLKVGTSAGEAGDWAAVPLFATIGQRGGIHKWKPRHVLVGAHCPPCPDCDIKLEKTLDPGSRRGRSGQEWIIFGSSIQTAMTDNADRFWRELLQAQRDFCRRFRFAPNLCPEYFIYSSAAEKAETDEVMVVSVSSLPKHMFCSRGVALPDLDTKAIEVTRVRASEAHTYITDVVKGRKIWRGNPVS